MLSPLGEVFKLHMWNHVFGAYGVAAVLYLQAVLHVMLFRPWNMFCTSTLTFAVVSVQCPLRLFFCCCIFLISCSPGTLVSYCLSDCEMVLFAFIIAGLSCAFTFHMRWISSMRSIYFKISTASFLITYLSPGIATSINMHIPFLLWRIMMSGLFWGYYYYYYYSQAYWIQYFCALILHCYHIPICCATPLVVDQSIGRPLPKSRETRAPWG